MSDTRLERDSMGEMPVPVEALYGASTQRAVLNFPVSGEPVEAGIIHAFGLIKWAAARVNGELGHVPTERLLSLSKPQRKSTGESSMTISRLMFIKPDPALLPT